MPPRKKQKTKQTQTRAARSVTAESPKPASADARPSVKPAGSKPAASKPAAAKLAASKGRTTKAAASKAATVTKPMASKAAAATKPMASKAAAATKPVASKAAAATRPVASKAAAATKAAAQKAAAVSKAATSKAPAKQTRKRAAPQAIYEDAWKEVYLAGTEWDQMQLVYSIDWDFDHLDDALTDGELTGNKVHLFGATEPQLIMRDEKDTKGDVIPVPVIVAVLSEVPPPATVGLQSVQRASEEIVPMSDVRMGWHAYAPDNVALSRRFQPNVYVLKCNERKARLRNMKEEAVHKYDYVLPYFIRPDQVEDVTVNTEVQVLVELEGRSAPLMCEYDYEMDDFDEFIEEQIKENDLDAAKHAEPLKKAVKEAEKATKLKYRQERLQRKKRIDAINPEEREAIKKMRLIKYYPQGDWPDVSKVKSPFINRYYGKANEVL